MGTSYLVRDEEPESVDAKLAAGDVKTERDEVSQSVLEPTYDGWIKKEIDEGDGKNLMELENVAGGSVAQPSAADAVSAVIKQESLAESDLKITTIKSISNVQDKTEKMDSDVAMMETPKDEVTDVKMTLEEIAIKGKPRRHIFVLFFQLSHTFIDNKLNGMCSCV